MNSINEGKQKAEMCARSAGAATSKEQATGSSSPALPSGVLVYTKAQMAAALQVSVRCITGMMRRGELSFLKINGRLVRFRPEEALKRLREGSGRKDEGRMKNEEGIEP